MKANALFLFILIAAALNCGAAEKPWKHGDLRASDNGMYLQHVDGTPFFWLGDTGWLLPQRLDRDEAQHYLEHSAREGFNVVQVQVLNGVPSFNRYGAMSNPYGWNMNAASRPGYYGYWEHLDHIMTFHPRGRTVSARWFADRDWIDFHMFQSGHRRYGQRMGNKDYPIPDDTEEDSWMYVDSVRKYKPLRPVLDGEPSYENIPQGLHFADEPLWNDRDVRRYAYWSVFRGACGHTYGNNNIMQFVRPGIPGAYFADGVNKPWYIALVDPGRLQMKHLKHLMLAFPYFDRVGDQSVVLDNGEKYDRIIATRGSDYLLAYNYMGRPMRVDLGKISGKEKKVWTMDPADGSLRYLGKTKDGIYSHTPHPGKDIVLIAIDSEKDFLTPDMKSIPTASTPKSKTDLNE